VVRSCDAWGIQDVHVILRDEGDDGEDCQDGIREHQRFYSASSDMTLSELMDKESVRRVSKGAHKVRYCLST
jgi:hypothetical protein